MEFICTGSYLLMSLSSLSESNCCKVDWVGGKELLVKIFELEGQMRL